MTPAITVFKTLAQLTVLFVAVAFAASFSNWPSYRQIPEGAGVLKLSFGHSASRRGDCRRRTPEELAELAPNMRNPMDCPRGRRSLATELVIDGDIVFSAELPPSGLSRDGPSQVYRRFVLPAGVHTIVARLRDTPREAGYDYELKETVDLRAGQSIAIDFKRELGGFILR